jgi:L-aspartate oxidase
MSSSTADAWATTNLHPVAPVLTAVAGLRSESRGGPVRSDFPARDDDRWRGHQTVRLDDDGRLQVSYSPVERSAGQTQEGMPA